MFSENAIIIIIPYDSTVGLKIFIVSFPEYRDCVFLIHFLQTKSTVCILFALFPSMLFYFSNVLLTSLPNGIYINSYLDQFLQSALIAFYLLVLSLVSFFLLSLGDFQFVCFLFLFLSNLVNPLLWTRDSLLTFYVFALNFTRIFLYCSTYDD